MKLAFGIFECIKLGAGIYIGWQIAKCIDEALGKIIDRSKEKINEVKTEEEK